MDLKNYDVSKLTALQADIQAELARKKQAQRQDVIKQVKALLAQHGMTLEDLPGRSSGGKTAGGRAKVAPKYRNKANPDQTWTGRGRKPLWVAEHLKRGGSLQDLAI